MARVLLPGRLPGAEIPEVSDLQEVNAMLAERVIKWTEEWEQQGLRKGLQQGLATERNLLARQVRHRFGNAVSQQSLPLLDRITDPIILEDIGEQLLDCADGEEWLKRLGDKAGQYL